MRHLIFATLGAIAIIAIGTFYSPASGAEAKVFGHYTKTDNHDQCLTPAENLDNKMVGDLNELILTIDSPEEIAKARKAFAARIGTTESNILPFDQIQIFKNGDNFTFDMFNTATPGNQCEFTNFTIDGLEFTLWLAAGDVQTLGHADHSHLGQLPQPKKNSFYGAVYMNGKVN